MNHHPSTLQKGGSRLLGCLYDRSETWDVPLSAFPDGSYALFRDSPDYLEVVSDPAGSRTIWYYFDDQQFVSSTSQRAIVMFLGSFAFDARVVPWILSTGSLGPELSWDRRIQRLPLDSSVVLDKRSWALSTRRTPLEFAEIHRSDAEHQRTLADAIQKTFRSLQGLDYNHWALPLSGGYDSRAILSFLLANGTSPKSLKTVTWGLKKSINEEGNDAKVAKELARALGTDHRYYHTDISEEEPVERVFDRFLYCGEGRIDHIAGYMDGLHIWRNLYEDSVHGVIRGDQVFGWSQTSSRLSVQYSVGPTLCSDFANLESIVSDFGLAAQEAPLDLEMTAGESLDAWRDRLFLAYRLPTIKAALADLKYSFVEQITPLLSRAIIDRVRELPDHLRTDKALWKRIALDAGPAMPYAKEGANADAKYILRKHDVVDVMRSKLASAHSSRLLGVNFGRYILKGIKAEDSADKAWSELLKKNIKRSLPRRARNWLKDSVFTKPKVDGNVLAFRVFMIVRMHEILSDDSVRMRGEAVK